MGNVKDAISKNILFYRKQKKMSQKDLAKQIGVNNSAISNWENGINSIDIETLFKVCKALDISIDTIFGESNKNNCYLNSEESEHIKHYRSLDPHGKKIVNKIIEIEIERIQQPIIEEEPANIVHLIYSACKASAGTGSFLFDDCVDEDITVLYNEYTRLADICISVSGDSMEPVFSDGDILLVRKQPAIEEGEYGIFIKGSQGYVKEKGADRLISLNPEYDDIYPTEEIMCYGKVIRKLEEEWIIEK